MKELHFCEACPKCRPAIIDQTTGKVLPEDHPIMQTAFRIWGPQPVEVKRAFIMVTRHNVQDPEALGLADVFLTELMQALTN